MNTEISTTEKLSGANGQDFARPGGRRNGLAWLATFMALASLTASGWLWWQDLSNREAANSQFSADLKRQDQLLAKADSKLDELQAQLSALGAVDPERRLSEIEHDLGSIRQSSESWQSLEDATSARMKSLQDEVENAQVRLTAAEARLTLLSARAVDGSAELDLAEVDYLLRLSQERLILFADTKSADRALELAGQHIAAFDNPMYLNVQREIAEARQALSELHNLDYQALDRDLDLLQLGVSRFAFRGERTAQELSGDSEATGWWERIRSAFSGLVTVHRSTGNESELPVLADQELVRQRAWLELEVARWAAARRDQERYLTALNRFSDTLERWFEPLSASLAQALRKLQQQDVDPPLPDISKPWTSLRALQGIGSSVPSRSGTSERNGNLPESSMPASGNEEAQSRSDVGDTTE